MSLRTLHRVFLTVCAGVVLAAMVAVMPATATAGGLQLTVRNSQYLWMGSRRPSFDSCSLITSLVSSFDPQTVPA